MKKISLICHIYKTEVPESDWEQTPASVKGRMEEMKELIQELEEKLNRTIIELMITAIHRPTKCRKERKKEKEWEQERGTTRTSKI